MTKLCEVVGILDALVGWFEGFIGLHVHREEMERSDKGKGQKGVLGKAGWGHFLILFLTRPWKENHVLVLIFVILRRRSEAGYEVLNQWDENDVPYLYPREPGFSIILSGKHHGHRPLWHSGGHVPRTVSESGPHGASKT